MQFITPMKQFMHLATPEEQSSLASKAGTSRAMLYQWAGGHRNASAAMAGQIEHATQQLNKSSKGRLPIILRTDLCEACQTCSYARKALGSRALVSELPIIDQLELPL